jgi:hypothetical protein
LAVSMCYTVPLRGNVRVYQYCHRDLSVQIQPKNDSKLADYCDLGSSCSVSDGFFPQIRYLVPRVWDADRKGPMNGTWVRSDVYSPIASVLAWFLW